MVDLGPGYTDPEVLIGRWLHELLGLKVRADPGLPDQWKYTAPLVHVQRGQSLASLALTLDDVTLDVDTYAENADHARQVARDVGTAIEFHLPKTTFLDGTFVTYAAAISRPMWAPDPALFRRTAAYRVILHGVV